MVATVTIVVVEVAATITVIETAVIQAEVNTAFVLFFCFFVFYLLPSAGS